MHTRDLNLNTIVSKVPQVTLAFWVVKILATTLGETGGDAVTMSWLGEATHEAKGTGYLIGTGIFGVIFIVAVLVQIRAKKFHPFLYWLTIVASTSEEQVDACPTSTCRPKLNTTSQESAAASREIPA
jgi:uncharacterized membrane-anchored protein